MSANALQLFRALAALRAAPDPRARDLEPLWRVVRAAVRRTSRLVPDLADDAEQDAMLAILRALPTIRASSPGEAARWLHLVCRSERIDTHRRERRHARARLRVSNDALEWVPGEVPLHGAPVVLEQMLAALDAHVAAVVADARPSERGRRIARAQARIAARRLLLGDDLPALRVVAGDDASQDVICKWVERGRAVLLPAIDRWLASASSELERDVAEASREIVAKRRADAGRARPERRRRAA